MITRRELLIAFSAGALAAPLGVFAQQQSSRVARIGLIGGSSASSYVNQRRSLIAGLPDLGYVEGKNLIVEYRWADGNYERLPGLAAELVQIKVDLIVAAASPGVQAAQHATATIPIVMVATADPVGSGFIASLARPGRNITGLSNINAEISGKYLDLLRAAVPKLSRVTVLQNPGHPNHPEFLKRIQAAGITSGVKVSPVQASNPGEIEAAVGAMKRERAGALIVLPDAFFYAQASRIAELAAQQRLPTLFGARESVESGALMSYGQSTPEQFYRAATYVDKILKGAKPGDLPVEQPTKFELVINMKTAKTLGLTMQDLLFRADKVIE